ncbi:MAG: hypothetical protein HYX90_01900 [Chloroflexi bacterium]|nr:hypothetical protein [Chloroflexota bacterium]
MRVSAVAEKAGIPSVTDLCSPFAQQGRTIAGMLGVPGSPIAEYPGHIETHSGEERAKNIAERLLPQIITGLTQRPKSTVSAVEDPSPKEIIFRGSFEEINAHFYENGWSEGLPIVPPAIEKVEEFLRYTDRHPDEVLGAPPPANREATVWNVAVNGVMAGCRPEYMPILIAIVEVMAETRFDLKDAGATPGWEALIILNGPIIKELGFNFSVGALRPGNIANTTIGRFWRLYLRNLPMFLPGTTDKGTWGRNFNVVLAENHECLKQIGWEPLSVQQGFGAEDNVVTIQSMRGRGYDVTIRGSSAQKSLESIGYSLLTFQRNRLCQIADEQSVLLGLTPLNAAILARAGYSKKSVQDYLWAHARLPARVFEAVGDEGDPWDTRPAVLGKSLCDAVRAGILPALYCESEDPDRLLPAWRSPDDLKIVVGGDPGRNRAMISGSNITHGLPTSKKIRLPANWQGLSKTR